METTTLPGLALWELLSYVVTVIGLPLAILTFWLEQRKERENEDEETYQLLSDAYADFLKLVMANPDLQLRSRRAAPEFTDEQKERRQVVFECSYRCSNAPTCSFTTTICPRSGGGGGTPGTITCGNGAGVLTSARCCRACWKARIRISLPSFNKSPRKSTRRRRIVHMLSNAVTRAR